MGNCGGPAQRVGGVEGISSHGRLDRVVPGADDNHDVVLVGQPVQELGEWAQRVEPGGEGGRGVLLPELEESHELLHGTGVRHHHVQRLRYVVVGCLPRLILEEEVVVSVDAVLLQIGQELEAFDPAARPQEPPLALIVMGKANRSPSSPPKDFGSCLGSSPQPWAEQTETKAARLVWYVMCAGPGAHPPPRAPDHFRTSASNDCRTALTP